MLEESEVQKKVESIEDLTILKTENEDLTILKTENEDLRTENEDLKRDISDIRWEIGTLNARIDRLSHEKDLEEYKRLKNKYIKLLGISRVLWSNSFEEIIPIGELIPGKQHLDLFNMK